MFSDRNYQTFILSNFNFMFNKKVALFLTNLLALLAVLFFVYFLVKTFMSMQLMVPYSGWDFFIVYLLAGLAFFTLIYLVAAAFNKYFSKK